MRIARTRTLVFIAMIFVSATLRTLILEENDSIQDQEHTERSLGAVRSCKLLCHRRCEQDRNRPTNRPLGVLRSTAALLEGTIEKRLLAFWNARERNRGCLLSVPQELRETVEEGEPHQFKFHLRICSVRLDGDVRYEWSQRFTG